MKKGKGNKRSGSENVNASDDGFYEVEAIRHKRMHKGEVQYLVKWEGWSESANTWEPPENLRYIPKIIDAFEKSIKSEKNGKRRRKNVSHHTQQQPNESSASVESSNKETDPKLSELKETTNNAFDDAVLQEEVASTSNPTTVPGNNDSTTTIVKILRATHYAPPDNNFKDVLINFLVLRYDETEDIVTNRYLKENYPHLLINYYEEIIRSQLI